MQPSASNSKTIVITGVTRGLGAALARWMADQGHRIAGCGRHAERLELLSRELGQPHRLSVVDVSDAAAAQQWGAQIVEAWGAPDLVVNNAALINANAALWKVPVDEFSQVIDVNIKGVYHVLRAFLPAMIQRKRGVVANISSTWGRVTSPEVAPYCATKWAVEGLTQSLAQELPKDVAAVAVNPGVIHTEMLESCFGAGAAAYMPPEKWVEKAGPFLLSLGRQHNGRPVSVPA